MDAGSGLPHRDDGRELALVGGREEATEVYEAPPSKSFLDLLTFLCKCCACRRRDWLPLPTDGDDLAPPNAAGEKRDPRPLPLLGPETRPLGPLDAAEEAKSPLRVGAGGSPLSPTVELFVYDDEDGPNSRRGLAPGASGRIGTRCELTERAGADWAHLDDAAAARILGVEWCDGAGVSLAQRAAAAAAAGMSVFI